MKNIKIHRSKTLDIYTVSCETELMLPLFELGSANDCTPDRLIDLTKILIKNEAATLLSYVKSNYMTDVNINDGDWLIIDKSLAPLNDKLALVFIDGAFTVKRIKTEDNRCWLITDNKNIEIVHDNKFMIWGIVSHVIKSV